MLTTDSETGQNLFVPYLSMPGNQNLVLRFTSGSSDKSSNLLQNCQQLIRSEFLSVFNIKRYFYLDVYTILNRINNMDHMRISGTELSSVILR